jgi:hypothetical protein
MSIATKTSVWGRSVLLFYQADFGKLAAPDNVDQFPPQTQYAVPQKRALLETQSLLRASCSPQSWRIRTERVLLSGFLLT